MQRSAAGAKIGRRAAAAGCGVTILDLTTLEGRTFTLLLMGTTPDGGDEWAVFSGVARLQDGALYVDRGAKPRFDVRPEWLEWIRAVEPDLRSSLLNADYFLALSVGALQETEDGNELLQTGLKWPG